MINNRTRINKNFEKAFVLNKSKAVRINDVIESNFKKNSINGVKKSFRLGLNNEKEMIFDDFNSIFEVDNGKKNRIENVRLNWSNKDINIDISFRSKPIISVDISSYGLDWTNQLFAEIEEQIERITLSDFFYRFISGGPGAFYKLQLAFISLAIPFLMIYALQYESKKSKNYLNLTDEEVKVLIANSDSSRSNEEKINFIFNTTKQLLKADQKKADLPSFNAFLIFFSQIKNYTIIAPILICIGLIWYMLGYCYPSYVFDWGDMEEEFAKLVERRKAILSILFGSIFLGILTNFFVWGLTS